MSLIEKALNKSSEEIKSPSSENKSFELDPRNIVRVPPSRRKHVYAGLGAVILLLALTLSLWLFFVTPEEFDQPSSGLHASNQNSVAAVPSPLTKEVPAPPPEKTVFAENATKLNAVVAEKQEIPQDDAAQLSPKPQTEPVLLVRKPEEKRTVHPLPSRSRLNTASHDLSRDDRIKDLLNKAYVYGQTGKYAQAVRCYDQVLSDNPQQYEALLNRGIIRQKMADSEGAEMDLLAAHRIQPDDPVLLNALGVLYLQKGNEDKAESFLLKAGDAISKINLALHYWKQGEHNKVISSLKEAGRVDSQNPYVPYYLGLFYRQTGDYPSAHDQFEKAIAMARKRGLIDVIHNIESLSLGP